jgi:aminoglycoside/choline kinase family phosphotransferase
VEKTAGGIAMSIAPKRLAQIKKFLAASGFKDAKLFPLAGDASFRRYIRIQKGAKKAMLMDAPPTKENSKSFLDIATYLCAKGYSAPEILAHDLKLGLLLLEDLGDDLFTPKLKKLGAADEQKYYAAAIDVLADWHKQRLANPKALALPAYNYELLMREVRLFSDWYLPQVLGKENALIPATEYLDIWHRIIEKAPLATDSFVHRDYHADNLIWLPRRGKLRRVGLLDFQDGVYGDAAYDLVSLLEDARRDVSPKLSAAMMKRYLTATKQDEKRFKTAYAILGAQRNSKIVGIFVRLAARDGKHQYQNYLSRVWAHLENDVKHPALAELKQWTDKYIGKKYRGAVSIRHDARELALTA